MVLSKRCRIYNEQLDLVEQLEDKGRIVVIRPEKPMEVDRIETDIKKLTDLYEEGYVCAKKCLKKNKYFKNKFLAKIVFINGDIGGMGDHSCYMGWNFICPI